MTNIATKAVNTIRTLSIDMIEAANSGHPGLPLGAAPMGYTLFHNHLAIDSEAPLWKNRDRFILSAGHGSALLYSLLHLTGFNLSIEDLKKFRQWESKTPGHPEFGITDGVEATTGPLGQGMANAVGFAMAEKWLADTFNRPSFSIVDHYTYTLVGDGCLMEGITAEASSIAGHLKLGKLIVMYDANNISLDGPLDLTFTENVQKRYESYGFQVIVVDDGDEDFTAIDSAISAAKDDLSRPSLIIVKTTIGFGSPSKAGTSAAHGAPLGAEEIEKTKKALGCNPDEKFFVTDDVYSHFKESSKRGKESRIAWEALFAAWQDKHPELAKKWNLFYALKPTENLFENLPDFEVGGSIATRVASSKVVNALHSFTPFLIGGDADLSCSTKTALSDGGDFSYRTSGANIHFGVREHAMGAIANGVAYHGGARIFTATFFSFADYMRPAIRMAALSSLPTISIFTHDSLAVGEDGPTHQPIEQLASLRIIPNLVVIRPSDATETAAAWATMLSDTTRPYALILSRQNLPVIDRKIYANSENLKKGGYILHKEENPNLLIIATGSEVPLAIDASKELKKEGIRVQLVSMPSMELFREQDIAYQKSVLPDSLTARMAVEAGTSFGWSEFVGLHGRTVCVDRFGASAPGNTVMQHYGFTVENIVKNAKEILK
ncbi:transketolase [bacterium]|nr:transketolase [bacterium]